MDIKAMDLYSELRTTKMELQKSLEDESCSPLIKPIIKAELHDIESTLQKLEKGNFGICELSGELMPMDLLMNVPTLKSLKDCNELDRYYRKGIY
ncbi:hypothetical protein KDN24_22040 [Bacillus sp. Bva_UNVM-123]|uniref:hypothetical protein n=1 Tax=Bacillus sp. Bva_UNVM-123 TaxID=2829798 RepID=UPI00391EF88C